MQLDTFLHHLHFTIDEIMPNHEVNWEDAPLPYKLYRNVPVIPLSSEIPISLPNSSTTPTLDEIGPYLLYSFGITQLCQLNSERNLFRRSIPSGGALYPNELYIYLKLDHYPDGIYHYDAAHHRLILLREGNFDSYLTDALGNRCNIHSCFGVAFVSTMFWKNFFKYNNFSYRLQGLDSGVLIGQLLECAKQFGYTNGVYFQFLDRAINHLLGLTEGEESVYAVIPLSTEPNIDWFHDDYRKNKTVTSHDLLQQIPPLTHEHFVRSKHVEKYPMITKINEASMIESTEHFQTLAHEEYYQHHAHTVQLPKVERLSYDFLHLCKERYSPNDDFTLTKWDAAELATLLQEASLSFPYYNDLDGKYINENARVSLYGCFYNVKTIENGAYAYNRKTHSIQPIRYGDLRYPLQSSMTMDNVNLFQVPLCLHVVGKKDYYTRALGYRGYRIHQMEAGILVHKLVFAATAMGMGGHPLLSFDTNSCDQLYGIDGGNETSLIQIPVGAYRARNWLKGSLHN
ncbi:SagB family peptide dehydrogenase [Bacillus toyonensis]|uniref:SagB family peptide dehydrogenase n=1 Tax=Bacillus toyonensis TaxID=155322 RepID=UPI0011A97B68|nr:SagB family peptide dehydrogenase [Bacillus toyonensis]UFH98957.1 SagB family peptide dehydrogenase [Bacillus toyonensis]UKS61485.1 SagB family peptide dehydrogenase [Bacillus toyonensis]